MKTRLRIWTVLAFVVAVGGSAHAQHAALVHSVSTIFTNPTPADTDYFGNAVSALGVDRVLIGAPGDNAGAIDSGAAYLFSLHGTLLTTFTNPTPTNLAYFGLGLATLGTDRVVIGAYGQKVGGLDAVGVAYVFSTNGVLLTTFTNPAPRADDNFGNALAVVGMNSIVVGAYRKDLGSTDVGAAYLFNTNGTLITTFANPTPSQYSRDQFGVSVAAVGSDKVIIGAYFDDTVGLATGSAYLFHTNGTLLRSFPNPSPGFGDQFGYSVAAVGTDKVLIGAVADDAGAMFTGAAYLYSLDGTLLRSFFNPSPIAQDFFAVTVASVGTDKVLIGAALKDVGSDNEGEAYLFHIDGTLLSTITNPTPAANDLFARNVASVNSDTLLIGCANDALGGTNSGVAYLITLSAAYEPLLKISHMLTGHVRVSWPLPETGYVLEQTVHLTSSPFTNTWSQIPPPYQTNDTSIYATITSTGSQFFRLRKP